MLGVTGRGLSLNPPPPVEFVALSLINVVRSLNPNGVYVWPTWSHGGCGWTSIDWRDSRPLANRGSNRQAWQAAGKRGGGSGEAAVDGGDGAGGAGGGEPHIDALHSTAGAWPGLGHVPIPYRRQGPCRQHGQAKGEWLTLALTLALTLTQTLSGGMHGCYARTMAPSHTADVGWGGGGRRRWCGGWTWRRPRRACCQAPLDESPGNLCTLARETRETGKGRGSAALGLHRRCFTRQSMSRTDTCMRLLPAGSLPVPASARSAYDYALLYAAKRTRVSRTPSLALQLKRRTPHVTGAAH